MQARRFTRLIDRLTLAGHPASEALIDRGLRTGTRRLGRAVGRLVRAIAPQIQLQRLGEAFDEGLEDSKASPTPQGRVLHFPGRC